MIVLNYCLLALGCSMLSCDHGRIRAFTLNVKRFGHIQAFSKYPGFENVHFKVSMNQQVPTYLQ